MTKASRPTKALIAAVVVAAHLSPLIPRGGKEPEKKKGPPEAMLLAEPELLEKDERSADPRAVRVDCPQTYDGIGVMVAFGSNRITNVAKGWPADKAGIRPGDIMEKPWNARAVNGYMAFTIIRNGKRTEFNLQTDNICFRDKPW